MIQTSNKLYPLLLRFLKTKEIMRPKDLIETKEYWFNSFVYDRIFECLRRNLKFDCHQTTRDWNSVWQYYVYKVLGFEKNIEKTICTVLSKKVKLQIPSELSQLRPNIYYNLHYYIPNHLSAFDFVNLHCWLSGTALVLLHKFLNN